MGTFTCIDQRANGVFEFCQGCVSDGVVVDADRTLTIGCVRIEVKGGGTN